MLLLPSRLLKIPRRLRRGGAGGGCKARAPATQPWMPGMAAAPRRFAFYGPTLPAACPAPGKDPELGCGKKKKNT